MLGFDRDWAASIMADNSEKDTETGCVLWTGSINHGGYGIVRRGPWLRSGMMAHRIAVYLSGRDVPEGMVVDHMCRVRRCVNPEHLRVVTRGQNVLENSLSPAAIRKAMKVCPKCELPFDKRRPDGTRRCSGCDAAYARDFWHRKKVDPEWHKHNKALRRAAHHRRKERVA